MLNETMPGGVYLAADGKTYQDANGKPVDEETVKAYQQRQAAQQQRFEADERTRKLTSPDALTVLSALVQQPAPPAEPQKGTE